MSTSYEYAMRLESSVGLVGSLLKIGLYCRKELLFEATDCAPAVELLEVATVFG
jgi:hypothetical protein